MLAPVQTQPAARPDDNSAETIDALERVSLGTRVELWWVLHTRSRNEKAVCGMLEREGIACYLPLVRVTRMYAGRVAESAIPLFPGYLFLCGRGPECEAAWHTRRVANVLPIGNQVQFCHELRQIIRAVESGAPLGLYAGLRDGQRCRVASGSLAGLEGVVLRRRTPSRMYIVATVLGQSAVVEIDGALLEPID